MNSSTKLQINEPILNWLDSLPKKIPLRAVSASSESASVERKQLLKMIVDSRLPENSLAAAMLWLRVGIIEPAHDIVQSGSTPLDSYLHGVVHRLEGDYWNAKYWFRQVNDNRLLQSLSSSIAKRIDEAGLAEFATNIKVIQSGTFSPAELVSACEYSWQQRGQSNSQIDYLERMGWVEWESLWSSCA